MRQAQNHARKCTLVDGRKLILKFHTCTLAFDSDEIWNDFHATVEI